MWPAITRMPFVAPVPARMFAVLVALIAALPIRDYLMERRVHPISVWAPSSSWRRFRVGSSSATATRGTASPPG
jgi:hypothetical protein